MKCRVVFITAARAVLHLYGQAAIRMKRIAAFTKRHTAWVVGSALGILIIIVAFVVAVHAFGWDWTGFGSDTGQGIQTPNGRIILVQLPKRLWDWLGLLVVPASLAVGALWFNKLQSESEQRRATDREREAALRGYFDAMSALLLSKDHPLRRSYRRDDVRIVARGRTLSILRAVDAARNVQVLQFLRDSHLIDEGQQIIDFTGADLSGDDLQKVDMTGLSLAGVDLRHANLTEARLLRARLIGKADLSEANLTGAQLTGTDLTDAILIRANLASANLIRATLVGANLAGANLRGANLRGADLSGADLTDASITLEQLAQAETYNAAKGIPKK